MLLLGLMLQLSVDAHAGQPTVVVDDDGAVIARVMVDASASTVKAAIPELQTGTSTNVLTSTVTRDGSCSSVHRTTRGLYRPLELSTRFCPTAQGWREWLTSSGDFTKYDAEWTVLPTDSGTSIQLRVKSDVNLMVPSSLLTSGTVSGVKETFAALLRKLGGG